MGIESIPPGWALILGALLVPVLRGRAKQAFLLLLPAAGLVQLVWLVPDGVAGLSASIFGHELALVRVDSLSRIWGIIFHIAALLSVVYSLHVDDDLQHVAALVYAGAAIGAVFAGDLITLFVYWELTAITSVFLIWASRSQSSYRAGMRYLIVQVGSGVLLLAGVALHVHQTGSIAFADFGGVDDAATALIFVAFGIKAAFPLLHGWLADAYPEATLTGTVWLSAFTTKLAIYALARGFPGEELLIPIGALMAVFPIFFAVLENDLRRVLAYSLNNQLGFMVVGIGIGTAASINGAAAHAFAHILYKSLLFMSMGAVALRAGTCRASELGGLYKSMPWTCAFCIVGAASISALPLTAGFVSKSIILTEASDAGLLPAFALMLFASGCVLLYSGIRVPYFAFFAADSGIRVKEAPLNMLVAMGITAALCIGIGVFPAPLYALLPSQPETYVPYTLPHVVTQLQLLTGSALAFALLVGYGMYPAARRAIQLDADWVYRRAAPSVLGVCAAVVRTARSRVVSAANARAVFLLERVHRYHGPEGVLAQTWLTGSMVVAVAILLTAILLFYFA
jgi:multicomponent Na+:H+ antiporter subunit D